MWADLKRKRAIRRNWSILPTEMVMIDLIAMYRDGLLNQHSFADLRCLDRFDEVTGPIRALADDTWSKELKIDMKENIYNSTQSQEVVVAWRGPDWPRYAVRVDELGRIEDIQTGGWRKRTEFGARLEELYSEAFEAAGVDAAARGAQRDAAAAAAAAATV